MRIPPVYLLSLLISLNLFNCSATHIIKPDENFTLSEEAIAYLGNDVFLSSQYTFVKADSVYMNSSNSNKKHVYHFSEINKLVVKDRIAGAAKGAGIGAAGGIGFVYIASDKNENYSPLSREFFAVLYGMLGGAIGGGIGYFYGDNNIYYFQAGDSLISENKGGYND